METIYNIQLDSEATYKVRANDDLNLHINDWCIIRKDFYLEYGKVIEKYGTLSDESKKGDYPRVERKATVIDQGKANENTVRAKSAFRTALHLVEQNKLAMKLLNAHYSFDCKLVTVQFTADGRIDFRELVKQLSQALNTRIELRQIGVRDSAAICGGMGVCGQQLCCNRFLKDFSSINVKMAKEQDLSLTPSTISGICGRLKCCLKYEHEGYQELEKTMPRRGDCCECKEGRGKICDRNLLTQEVVVQLSDTGRTLTCSKDEIVVAYPEKHKLPKNKGKNKKNNQGKKQENNNQKQHKKPKNKKNSKK